MVSQFIIDVSEIDFEYEVLKFSHNTPVVVDFWATWCRPCKVLSPILERLTIEANGSFRLARVDVDQNPNLVMQYGIRTIPTVKAFSQAKIVSEFVDAQPEPRLREFLNKIAPPSPINLAIEKGIGMINLNDWGDAEEIFLDVLEKNPDQPEAMVGLSMALIGQGRANDALMYLHNFPMSKQLTKAEILKPLAEAMLARQEGKLHQDQDLDALLSNSIRLSEFGNIPSAIDGFLEILRQDRNYRDGLARKITIALLELLGEDNPQTREYRSELASILF